jgi:hypothetical protein
VSRLTITVLLLAGLAATSGCGVFGKPVAHAPAIGDTCLVGTWTLQEEVNTSGYSLNNVTLPVTGLRGAIVTFSSDGKESESFDGSAPLVGQSPRGDVLSITIGGSIVYRIHAADGDYTETGSKTQLPTMATLNGAMVEYHSSYEPGSGTYSCAGSNLTMITKGGVQTAMWSRG